MPHPPKPVPLPDLSGYLTTAQVSAMTGWQQTTVANYLAAGRLRGVKLASIWLVEPVSLLEYLAALPVQPDAARPRTRRKRKA